MHAGSFLLHQNHHLLSVAPPLSVGAHGHAMIAGLRPVCMMEGSKAAATKTTMGEGSPVLPRQIPSATAHPLFSMAAASSVLVLLYLPRCLFPFLLSPVPISTLLLLATLLRLGSGPTPPANAGTDLDSNCGDQEEVGVDYGRFEEDDGAGAFGWPREAVFPEEFPGWLVGGPLEVIYEEYEGEEEEEVECVERPMEEGSSRDDSGSEFDGNIFFRWLEVEDDWDDPPEEEEMIEISLDEESLIEIDLTAFS